MFLIDSSSSLLQISNPLLSFPFSYLLNAYRKFEWIINYLNRVHAYSFEDRRTGDCKEGMVVCNGLGKMFVSCPEIRLKWTVKKLQFTQRRETTAEENCILWAGAAQQGRKAHTWTRFLSFYRPSFTLEEPPKINLLVSFTTVVLAI